MIIHAASRAAGKQRPNARKPGGEESHRAFVAEYEKELIALCGAKTVPVLVVEGKPLRGCEEINQFLVGKFL